MQAGFASVEITPDVGTPIAGNIREDNLSHGVFHPLYARSVCLFDGERYVSLTSADLCGIRKWQVDEIRKRVAESTPLKPDTITVSAIHTHSGPDTGLLHPGTENLELVEKLVEGISQAIIEAFKRLAPAKLKFGKGENSSLAHNRRVWGNDGELHMNWEKLPPGFLKEEAGPVDPEILVLSCYDEHDRLKGLVLHFTMHPAVLAGDNNLNSADYVGFMIRRLASHYDGNPEVIYLNGAAGNINHLNPWDTEQIRGFAEAERIGNILADSGRVIIERSEAVEVDRLFSISSTLQACRRKISPERIAWARDVLDKWDGKPISLVDGFPDEAYAKATLELAPLQDKKVDIEFRIIRIGPINIVTLPGEFFVEYGLRIKDLLGKGTTMIADLANGSCGYVPTLQAFEQGGYEPTLGHQSYLAEDTGEKVIEAIRSVWEQTG